jgi:hypothetical protein
MMQRPRADFGCSEKVGAAGIAPACQNAQSILQQQSCVNTTPPCLHIACTDFDLRELVASWRRLSADVKETIVRIARGEGDCSPLGE